MPLEPLLSSNLADSLLRAKIDALILHHLHIVILGDLRLASPGSAGLPAASDAPTSPLNCLLMIDQAQATPIAAFEPARSFGGRLVLDEAQAGAAAMIAAFALHRSRLMLDQTKHARIAHAGLSDRSGLVLDQAETASSRAATVLQYLFSRRINLKLVTRLVLDCLLLRVLMLLGARVGLFVLHLLISWMREPASSGG